MLLMHPESKQNAGFVLTHTHISSCLVADRDALSRSRLVISLRNARYVLVVRKSLLVRYIRPALQDWNPLA